MSDDEKFKDGPVLLTRQELLPGFENGQYEQPPSYDRNELRPALLEELSRRDNRVSIRVSGKDLAVLQRLALAEEIPTQTLIANVIHHFAQGLLVYAVDKPGIHVGRTEAHIGGSDVVANPNGSGATGATPPAVDPHHR